MRYIDAGKLEELASRVDKTGYGAYLRRVLADEMRL